MMEENLQNRIAVVLVRARNPLNIGAVARAMSNFGFADLRVVNDYDLPFQDARSAIDAAPVLNTALQFGSVAEAVADCTLVYGTTALGERRLLHPVDMLRDAQTHVRDAVTTGGRVAVLFGSEKTGLSADEMSHCHRLLTVPMHQSGVSMNLGQAAAVCLYELIRESATPQRPLPPEAMPANAEEIARMEAVLGEVLEESGYAHRYPANMREVTHRRMVRRMTLDRGDVDAWIGVLRQVLWKLRSPKS
ncbi:RNA methyltransferase [Terriglobus sp. ADX1]|uniref:RNA methyltransferase n=1 Tax=Terriglobus sp. ADX1 TaxID=2794063 RepID=UPI002FE56B3B